MRLLVDIDRDDSEAADFLLADLRGTPALLQVRARLAAYARALEADPGLVAVTFRSDRVPVSFHAGPRRPDACESERLPAGLYSTARVPDGWEKSYGLRELTADGPAGPGLAVQELTEVYSDEGLYWRAFHAAGDDMGVEVVSAPVEFNLLRELLGGRGLLG